MKLGLFSQKAGNSLPIIIIFRSGQPKLQAA
jgi:hypothetical protein